jgi:hypothetical protein
MQARRRIAALVLVIGLTAATLPGVAASLGGLTPRKLGADSAVVSACDSDGFSVSYTNSGGNVTSVDVSGIADPGCEGGLLSVVLANASGTSIGASTPTTVPTDAGTVDNTMTVSLSPTPAASAVAAVHVAVTGP